jgi:hypothetical protein
LLINVNTVTGGNKLVLIILTSGRIDAVLFLNNLIRFDLFS